MFFLVRKSVLGSLDELQDLDFDVKELQLGSQESCDVVLDELPSGILTIKALNASNAQFSCTGGLLLELGDKTAKSGKLIANRVYRLGVYDLEVINPPDGFDFAINILRSKRKSVREQKQYSIETKKRIFSIRHLSYAAFIAIILLFLVVPYLAFQNQSFKEKISDLPVPSDKLWSSGPLAMAHRIPEIGDNCNVCHVKPFEKVPDKQCLSCHQTLGDHVANNHPAVEEMSQFLCENCHKEHNEPMQLTRTDDTLCIDCHKDIAAFNSKDSNEDNKKSQQVSDVKGFNSENHPPFRLSLLNPLFKDGQYEWLKQRVKFDPNNPVQEQSNLKFSHSVHLDVEKVQNESSGDPLECNSCHQLQSDNEHFKPITMDKDCRSCHKLTFDVFNPDLELQHGDLRTATVMLQAHYIREFTDPDLREKRSRKKIRRIPGKHSNSQNCVGTGLECGRAEALKEAMFQFTKSGCITCHEVTENNTDDLLSKWFVKPIRLNLDWYTKARFDHVSHLSVKNKNEQQICLTCHQVEKSDDSSDIAMPQRNKCLECHQQDEHNSVELSCIRCHEFHFED
ncbi:MAG: cytochrome c3 family protein [Proteobacteria bacterium]|nr:cytochrome c3 family protein [Pseudomonadota bacterium]